jgi:hypothetical protein
VAFGYTRDELLRYAPDRPSYQSYVSQGQQQQVVPYSQQGWNTLQALGVAGAGVGGFAFAQRLGYNPWDPIYKGIRTVEEFSPGKIFRTFQLGNFVSQFTTEGRSAFSIAAKDINVNSTWFQELLHRSELGGSPPLPGRPDSRLETALAATDRGLQFRDGTLFAGEGNVVLRNATVMRSTGTPSLATAYARATGFNLPGVDDNVGLLLGDSAESIYFTGASSKARAAFNQAHALAGEWTVGRANRLADAPFGIEPFTTGLARTQRFWERTFGHRLTLAVDAGTPLQTLGRMGMKWGGVGTAAFLAYQTADWATRNIGLLDGTIFGEGITGGIAGLGAKANLTTSKLVDALPGARRYQQAQEELAPGSTSLLKLSAFPATGLLAGGIAYWASGTRHKVNHLRELMAGGLSYTQALPLMEQHWLENSSSIIDNNPLTRRLKRKYGDKVPFLGKITRGKGFALLGLTIGAIPVLPFLPGALMPAKTGDELERIYSGQEEVPIRKGRFWELGRTPYEGTKIEYFRPHWYARMMQRSRDKSLHGDSNPIAQWFRENFTYDVEREHYRDRPYPITGTAFEDVPIIGPFLGATIGRIIKPPRLMHTEEWAIGGGSLRIPGRLGELPPGEGESGKGVPVDPNSVRQVVGEQIYRLSELSGLTGFTASTFKEKITGTSEFFDQEERLQSASRMYGAERSFWDLNMGGAVFTNELVRRWFPHRRRQIEEYNPIRNTMPGWLPGPGERSQDFQHGDPFVKVQEGEMRLPGAGYAARFSELDGVAPEDYPLIHRYKILSDIAPYAERTKIAERELMGLAKAGQLSDEELAILQETRRQSSARKETKQFYNFEVLSNTPDIALPESLGANQSRSVVAALNRILAAKNDEKIGPARTLVGGYWEGLGRVIQNPFESLTPFAPGSKLLNMKSAIGDYKQTQVFGPDIAFWENPIENFIKPFFREMGDLVGMSDVPAEVRKKRGLEEYFDILQYVKNKRLAEVARQTGVEGVSGAYERTARETAVGINPYTRDYSGLFRSLPRSERDYFGDFVGAQSQEDRQEILGLVPANLRRIYAAQWEQQYAAVIQQALDKDMLPDDIRRQAEGDLQAFYARRESEGFPVNPDLMDQYQDQQEGDESYSDWYRRAILIPQIVGEEGLPGPDWVGWSPQVDLEEVKLKVVQNEGMDIHDFNLWQSDERSAAGKPYLDDVAENMISTVVDNEARSPQQIQQEVRKILSELGIGSNAQIFVYEMSDDRDNVEINVEATELRDEDMRRALNERLEDLG